MPFLLSHIEFLIPLTRKPQLLMYSSDKLFGGEYMFSATWINHSEDTPTRSWKPTWLLSSSRVESSIGQDPINLVQVQPAMHQSLRIANQAPAAARHDQPLASPCTADPQVMSSVELNGWLPIQLINLVGY